jgi:hypothetical protein
LERKKKKERPQLKLLTKTISLNIRENKTNSNKLALLAQRQQANHKINNGVINKRSCP